MQLKIKKNEVLELERFLRDKTLADLGFGSHILPFRICINSKGNSAKFQIFEDREARILDGFNIKLENDTAILRQSFIIPELTKDGELTEQTKEKILSFAIAERLFDLDNVDIYSMLWVAKGTNRKIVEFLREEIQSFYEDNYNAICNFFNLALMNKALRKLASEDNAEDIFLSERGIEIFDLSGQACSERICLSDNLRTLGRKLDYFNLYIYQIKELHQRKLPIFHLRENKLIVDFGNADNHEKIVFTVNQDDNGFYLEHSLNNVNVNSFTKTDFYHVYAIQALCLLLDIKENPIVNLVNHNEYYTKSDGTKVSTKDLHTLLGSYILAIYDFMGYTEERFTFLNEPTNSKLADDFLTL